MVFGPLIHHRNQQASVTLLHFHKFSSIQVGWPHLRSATFWPEARTSFFLTTTGESKTCGAYTALDARQGEPRYNITGLFTYNLS